LRDICCGTKEYRSSAGLGTQSACYRACPETSVGGLSGHLRSHAAKIFPNVLESIPSAADSSSSRSVFGSACANNLVDGTGASRLRRKGGLL